MKPSMLIIPATRPALIAEAIKAGVGSIIFDLEDNVAINQKDEARITLINTLDQIDLSGIDIVVRINPIDTEYGINDLKALSTTKVDAIVIPKATIDLVNRLDKELEGTDTRILPLIESCISVEQSLFIVQHPRVVGLMLGAEDLAADLEVERTKEGTEILYARQRIVNACKAVKKECIDTYYTDIEDIEGLSKDATFANSIGFTGKVCLSYTQVPTVNKAFIPTFEEIEYAKEVLQLVEKSRVDNSGPYSIRGKMIDRHMTARAEKLLQKATVCGVYHR